MYAILHLPSKQLLGVRWINGGVRLEDDPALPLWTSVNLPLANMVRRLGDEAIGAGTFSMPVHFFDPALLQLVAVNPQPFPVEAPDMDLRYESMFPLLQQDVVDVVMVDLVQRGVAAFPTFSQSFMLERFNVLES